ncbi:IS66 family transposase [Streptomyces marianii]|uniref:IS66 family transposase n=1 Tax=Streptomyces marianii TaxID=1817406 RepID=A0A5R9E7Q4_9ACTN|nr:IS66 family transposase [Streptomyces marianii]TLQ44041.1 IS66 family transposase [Streptomyces marianii]TLQ44043.1 IS66 family transposase [Streptomyces marianii]
MSSGWESASREDLLTVIGLLQRQNEELAAANERLTARVAELERRLGRNSGNSSMPPSSDTFGRPEKKPVPKSGRKRGRQPGADGSGLCMVADPDATEDRIPAACTGCGRALGEDDSIGFERRQVRDTPLTTVKVTEHRAHRCRCTCGTVTASPMPEQLAGSPSSYGPNLPALAVYLLVFQHIPVERTAQLIRDVTGAGVSTGWVGSLLPEAASLVEDSLNLIRALLIMGHVLHADETTTRIGTTRRWLHVACTDFLTPFHLAPRSRAGADAGGVLPHYRGVLVHDSLSLYAGYGSCTHQLCGTHLIRELTATEEDFPDQKWHQQIRWALAGLNTQALRVRSGQTDEITPDALLLHLKAFHHGITVGLSQHPRAEEREQSTARNLLERLRDQAHAVLRFADDPRQVPFTNNCGERALRPVKTS